MIFLQPVFIKKLWGGNRLKQMFAYPIQNNHTGEALLFSLNKENSNISINGKSAGQTIYTEWRKHFGNDLLELNLKFLDATKNISIQVHPIEYKADEYWYILHAVSNAKIIYGHNALSVTDLIESINAQDYSLLVTKDVKKGDLIHIPAGIIHSLGAGIIAFEIQKPNVTYRISDYQRLDFNDKLRSLNIAEAMYNIQNLEYQKFHQTQIINLDNNIFCNSIVVKTERVISNFIYLIAVIANGYGLINDIKIKAGDVFVVFDDVKKLYCSGYFELFFINKAI